jgi:hypothetical protein
VLFYLVLVLALYHATPNIARYLQRFNSGLTFIGGVVVFYFVLFALCKMHVELQTALRSFYAYALSPFIALLAIASGGFLVFTVWVFSFRTKSVGGVAATAAGEEKQR